MSGGGSGGGGQNTVTQSQQIPLYEQQQSQANQALASSLGAQPYPQYPGPLISGFTPLQGAGQQMATQAASNYQPYLQAAGNQINTSNLLDQNVYQQVGAANQQTTA